MRSETMLDRSDVEVVIVGAGPYGLSAASHLRASHRSTAVIGDIMSFWKYNMPPGMFLKSTPRASAIASPANTHSYSAYRSQFGLEPVDDHYAIPIEEFISYGSWFADELVPVVNDTVKELRHEKDHFACSLNSGTTIRTKTVVMASGAMAYAHLPASFSEIKMEYDSVYHSSELVNLATLSGSEIAIIGAGQSALEGAVLATEAGAKVHLIVRKPELRFGDPPGSDPLKPGSLLGPGWSLFSMEKFPHLIRRLPTQQRAYLVRSVLGPSGAWWLAPRFQGIETHVGVDVRVAEAKGDDVALTLSDSTELVVHRVIVATGYRVNPSKISYLDERLRTQLAVMDDFGSRLSPNFESPVDGLFLTGLSAAPTFGPLLRFVAGTGFTARQVERGVAAALSREK